MKILKTIFIFFIATTLVGCASTGKYKTCYVEVEREEPKGIGAFGGFLGIAGGTAHILSGNPIEIIYAILFIPLETIMNFKSVNKRTIEIREYEDGSVTTKPID